MASTKAESFFNNSELQKKLFESHTAVMLIIDPATGSIVDANPAAARYYGWTQEELRQMKIQDINMLPEQEVMEEMKKAQTQKRDHFEFQHRLADGSSRQVDVYSCKFAAYGNEYLHSIIHDITARKRAEEALLKTGNDLQRVYDLNPDLLCEADSRTGLFTRLNPAWIKVLGWSLEELYSRPLIELIHPDDRESTLAEVAKQLEGGETHRFENRYLAKDGTYRWLSWKATAADENGILYAAARDVTDRKRLEIEREQYFKLFNAATDTMVIADPNGCFKKVNPACLETLGYSEAELLAKPFVDFVHPDDRQATIDEVARQMERGFSLNFENRYLCKDGTYRWLSWRAVYVSREMTTYATARDITESKQAERRLREYAERLEVAQRGARAGLWYWDMVAETLEWSPELLRLFGLDPAKATASFETWHHALHPDDRERATHVLESAIKERIPYACEYRVVHPDGQIRWLSAWGTTTYEKSGRAVRMSGICVDITKRKLAEEKIRKNEAYIRNILDTVDDGFIVVDPAYRIITANKAYCDQVSLPCKKVEGSYCYEVCHLAERPCFETGEDCAVHEAFAKGVTSMAVHKHFNKEGEPLFMETKAFPNRDEAGNIISVIETTRNITERHLLEAEQLKTQKLEAIGTLAGGIAHDFNNLLQGVFGYVSMARMASNRPEKVIEMLDQAEKALSLSVNLTTQLLTFAKGGNPVKKKVDLRSVIENATKFALSGSRCDCLLHLDQDMWPAEVDEGQIAQVIQNIVLNASEAMPEGGVVDLLSENITLPDGGRQIRITIKDSGMGIPKSYLSKIFDPYFTTKQKGSGLGLATSYSIIKNHGGTIEVESAQNKGSTFFITIPACAPEIPEEKPPHASGDEPNQKRRILLMDDEAMVRDVAKSMLEVLGHEIELACHGEEAIGKYQEALTSGNPFDLVILDLTIKGGMGGQEAMRRLKEIDPKVTAVVSSGYSDNPIVSDYTKYGFKGLLNKPYSIEAMTECLSSLPG